LYSRFIPTWSTPIWSIPIWSIPTWSTLEKWDKSKDRIVPHNRKRSLR
jgi:hypothetical protein